LQAMKVLIDGVTDEGPTHEEVQFWFAVRHLEEGKLASLPSSCSSGSSFLNHVELQNGCLSLGHANLFIPSIPLEVQQLMRLPVPLTRRNFVPILNLQWKCTSTGLITAHVRIHRSTCLRVLTLQNSRNSNTVC